MKFIFVLLFSIILIGNSCDADAEDFGCLSASEASSQFQSGKIESQPYYDEAPFGGARVQKEHPETYLFAQSKFLIANGVKGAICQYSNHVGLVSTYYELNMENITPIDECEEIVCEGKSHWRSEWTNALTEDEKTSQERITVCVKTIAGIDYPSVECGFKSVK